MTADVTVLNEIHRALAETYRQMVSPREVTRVGKDGEEVTETVYPTAAELNAANAFLKQNNITSSPGDDPGIEKLREAIASRRARKAPVLPDFEDGPAGPLQ